MSSSVLIDDKAVAEMFGISRPTVWRRVSDGEFPRPIKIGGSTRWRKDEMEAVIERASEARGAA